MYAIIAVNRAVNQLFHYEILPELEGQLYVGHLVEVDFGPATLNGIVIDFDTEAPVEKIKPVRRLLDPIPVLTSLQIELAFWLQKTTLTPIGQCLWLMLPPGLTSTSAYLYTLLDPDYQSRSVAQKRIISLLHRRGALTNHQLERLLPKVNWKTVITNLEKRGVVTKEKILRPPLAKPKNMQAARLAIEPRRIPDIALHLGRESRRANVIEILLKAPHQHMPMKTLLEAAGYANRSPVNTLAKAGYVAINEDDTVQLILSDAEARQQIINFRGAEPYIHILNYLAPFQDSVPIVEIIEALGVTRQQIKRLGDEEYVILGAANVWRDPVADMDVNPDTPPRLTKDQSKVWGTIRESLIQLQNQENTLTRPFLLHGVTGSGKTEIYLHAVELVINQGRQAIVLVPEIALTVQLVRRFMARFQGKVSVIHSGLSVGERYDTWRRARAGDLAVIVGARSALFAPLPDVGLVILDEEHDSSYKNDPSSFSPPFYHAREVAIEMMKRNNGLVILGSATPDVASYFRAEQGEFALLEMPKRILAHQDKIKKELAYLHLEQSRFEQHETQEVLSAEMPPVTVIDMRQELRAGNSSIFSRVLQHRLEEVLRQNQQAILFLNRRGTNTFVLCRDCGYIAQCSHCDSNLTYHQTTEELVCHHCGRKAEVLSVCPNCNSHRIRHFGTGTELVHRAIQREFPHARILRWDQDTASRRHSHAEILQKFLDRQADILVGTQMIAKGLDIPLVTLVGIISGDTALGMPDYRTGERTFQLLTQVAGRAGRGVLGGSVVLQTYQPEHYAIQAAAQHDFRRFYDQEIAYRRNLMYPPYVQLVRLLFRHRNQGEVLKQASQVTERLRKHLQNNPHFGMTEIIGPTPSFYTRLDNYFRWQILIRTTNPVGFLDGVDLPADVFLDIAPVNLL